MGKLKESWADLESQVNEKKLFVTAGLELQQVITAIFINTPSVFKVICSGLHLLIFCLTVWLIHKLDHYNVLVLLVTHENLFTRKFNS